jgi:uncharacterized membrane protein YdjX (TVP38/TMEM64 family)
MRASFPSFASLDPRSWRKLATLFIAFGGLGLVLLLAAPALGLNHEDSARRWLAFAAHSPWGLPIAIAAFSLLAFLGAPQFVLIAAAVATFGPWEGFAYSWIGTLISALLGFGLGRRFGAQLLREVSGEPVRRFMRMIARNGFSASLIVRLVPSAPFIIVNMVAGMTPMRFVAYLAGTGVGIIPKIALTAFAGGSLIHATRHSVAFDVAIVAAAAGVWVLVGLAARAWLRREEGLESR